MIKVDEQHTVEYKYESRDEMAAHEKLMRESGWYVKERSSPYTSFWRLYAKRKQHPVVKPLDAWHEDIGDCLWWAFPIVEPPYCGNPCDEHFPDYVTHFTRIDVPKNRA